METTPFYCADSTSVNYAAAPANGVAAPWLCIAAAPGCLDSTADNFQHWATEHVALLCHFAGCNDTAARNFVATVSLSPPCGGGGGGHDGRSSSRSGGEGGGRVGGASCRP